METSFKKCIKCLETKEFSFFSNRKVSKDGKRPRCKQCEAYEDHIRFKANIEKNRNTSKEYHIKNREKILSRRRMYVKNNHELIKELDRLRKKNNPAKERALAAIKRAKKLQATPPWLTKAHKNEIVSIYQKAREQQESIDEKFHVDHIIPLQNQIVCGLHIPWNLRITTAKENLSKNNKLIKELL